MKAIIAKRGSDAQDAGAFSEYHLVDQRIAALAPKNLSPEDAAAMPLTSITAREGLFERLGFVFKTDDMAEQVNCGCWFDRYQVWW